MKTLIEVENETFQNNFQRKHKTYIENIYFRTRDAKNTGFVSEKFPQGALFDRKT